MEVSGVVGVVVLGVVEAGVGVAGVGSGLGVEVVG